MAGSARRRSWRKSTSSSNARFSLVAVVRPEGPEPRLAVLAPEDAEEVLEPAVGRPERVALDVEEDVARRGLRQQLEAALRLRLEQAVGVRARSCALRTGARPARAAPRRCDWVMRGTSVSGGAVASSASVAIPASLSRGTWSRRMPATSVRWSSALPLRRAALRKSQIEQCETGSGYVSGGSATNSRNRCRTRR